MLTHKNFISAIGTHVESVSMSSQDTVIRYKELDKAIFSKRGKALSHTNHTIYM